MPEKPFYDWCEVILGCLYREILEDYALLYIGRHEEAEILLQCAAQDAHCRQLTHRAPRYGMSLQGRMQALSRLIRLSCGECRVFCVAERVSASCMVRSRPYLTHIRFKDDLGNL